MEIVFVGGVWSKAEEPLIIKNSKGNVQSAANNFQQSIINGLELNINKPVTIINELFIGSYPRRFKKGYIRKKVYNHSDNPEHTDYRIGFINLPIIKHYSRYHNSKSVLKELGKQSDTVFVGYSMTYSVLKALNYVKKSNPSAKTCLIIPDLPEYMNLGRDRGFIFNLLKKKSIRDNYRLIQQVDFYVVLTEAMLTRLPSGKPYSIIEGIAPSDTEISTKELVPNKAIVYTGSLDKKYGVVDLVDAFSSLDDHSLSLIICGAGDSEEYIKHASSIDKRIQYLGVVDTDRARALQRSAYLLVNPRNSNEEYTKYSFPSKTMEYMLSGTPVLMYKLEGIPDEYDSYLFYVDDDLTTSLRNVINEEPALLFDMGNKAKQFIEENKNPLIQTRKILELLSD